MDSHKSKGEMNCQTSTHDLWAVVCTGFQRKSLRFFFVFGAFPEGGLEWHGGHLRPQNPVTCDHKQKNRIWVTCDHKVRSLTTTKRHIRWQGQQNLHSARGHLWPHFAVTCDQKLGSLGLIIGSLVPTHGVGGVGGVGWDDNMPCTCTHNY